MKAMRSNFEGIMSGKDASVAFGARGRPSLDAGVRSSKNKRHEKKEKDCAIGMRKLPYINPISYIFTAKYGYVLNIADPPLPAPFQIDAATGYLKIPLANGAALGFVADPPEKEEGFFIGNYISALPPFNPAPVNNLPVTVTTALYTFVDTPSTVFPFWFLKPLNYLSNATREWQPNDYMFIQTGPFRGVRRFQFIDYVTSMVWVEESTFSDIDIFCLDFCNPCISKRHCGPQRWLAQWKDFNCGDCSESDSSSSSGSDCD